MISMFTPMIVTAARIIEGLHGVEAQKALLSEDKDLLNRWDFKFNVVKTSTEIMDDSISWAFANVLIPFLNTQFEPHEPLNEVIEKGKTDRTTALWNAFVFDDAKRPVELNPPLNHLYLDYMIKYFAEGKVGISSQFDKEIEQDTHLEFKLNKLRDYLVEIGEQPDISVNATDIEKLLTTSHAALDERTKVAIERTAHEVDIELTKHRHAKWANMYYHSSFIMKDVYGYAKLIVDGHPKVRELIQDEPAWIELQDRSLSDPTSKYLNEIKWTMTAIKPSGGSEKIFQEEVQTWSDMNDIPLDSRVQNNQGVGNHQEIETHEVTDYYKKDRHYGSYWNLSLNSPRNEGSEIGFDVETVHPFYNHQPNLSDSAKRHYLEISGGDTTCFIPTVNTHLSCELNELEDLDLGPNEETCYEKRPKSVVGQTKKNKQDAKDQQSHEERIRATESALLSEVRSCERSVPENLSIFDIARDVHRELVQWKVNGWSRFNQFEFQNKELIAFIEKNRLNNLALPQKFEFFLLNLRSADHLHKMYIVGESLKKMVNGTTNKAEMCRILEKMGTTSIQKLFLPDQSLQLQLSRKQNVKDQVWARLSTFPANEARDGIMRFTNSRQIYKARRELKISVLYYKVALYQFWMFKSTSEAAGAESTSQMEFDGQKEQPVDIVPGMPWMQVEKRY